MRLDKRVRVFYPNKSSRDTASVILKTKCKKMVDRATLANTIVQKEKEKRATILMENVKKKLGIRPKTVFPSSIDEALTDIEQCLMDDRIVYHIDDYASTQGSYGIDIPEKLFWEGYIVPSDITRAPGSDHDTGRPSMPEFQQMNIETLRTWTRKANIDDSSGPESNPRPVLWHGGCGRLGEEMPDDCDPLCPMGLLMAYEENGNVKPVVSDFDCFLLGTRGVKYSDPLGSQELSMLSVCIEEIEGILATPKQGNWTQRWLEVKKKHAMCKETSSHEMPRFGYADPRSYKIMTGAVRRLKSNGAVRHGPECFNYEFPQDMDDQYLVVSDELPGVPWRYTNSKGLINILCEKVDQGFTFPLNPKWILCDPGWKRVYDKLLASEKANVQDSMDIWYPGEIRRRIDEISTKYPNGFDDRWSSSGKPLGVETDLAKLELRRYKVRMESFEKIRRAISSYNGIGLPTRIASEVSVSEIDGRRNSHVDLKTKSSNAKRNLILAAVTLVNDIDSPSRENRKERK